MFKEHELLSQLITNDIKLADFTQTANIIHHGLAPILSVYRPTTELQKSKLLEIVKHSNWHSKVQQLTQLLNQHNIKFILFKGFAYNYTLYQNQPLRPHSDIDVFVDKKDYKFIENFLLELGYKAVASRQGRFVSFQNSFYDGKKINTIFDIHWQISNRLEIHAFFPFEKLYKSSITIKDADFTFQTLDSIHTFIYACFHFQAHRPEDRKHIWLYDIALLWMTLNKTQKEQCLNLALDYNLYDLIGGTLQILQSTFGNKLIIYHAINKPFAEKSTYLKARKHKAGDFLQRLNKLNGFKEKLLYLSEYLFQSRHYVQSRYKLQSSRWVYFFYPRMWFEDICKLIKKP